MRTLILLAAFLPGMWMYHCHIAEHAEGGMMGEIHVQ
jgi:FtsP/CotA-like multicopper oxidase with cupredoxin domain